ncbi:MAG: T9SS type A sorting domain-containing protein [Cyclobacteriaceae bacterium]
MQGITSKMRLLISCLTFIMSFGVLIAPSSGQEITFSKQTVGGGEFVTGPILYGSEFSHGQTLYYPEHIGFRGEIREIRYFQHFSGTALTNARDWIVRLGTTDKEEFLEGDTFIPDSLLTKVFEGTIQIVGSGNKTISVVFDTPFNYDGLRNLVIEVEEVSPGINSGRFDVFIGSEDFNNPPIRTLISGSYFRRGNSYPQTEFIGDLERCQPIDTYSIEEITESAAVVNFDNGNEVGNTYRYRVVSGTATSTGDFTTSGAPIALSDLLPAQHYELHLKSDCDILPRSFSRTAFATKPLALAVPSTLDLETFSRKYLLSHGQFAEAEYTSLPAAIGNGSGIMLRGLEKGQFGYEYNPFGDVFENNPDYLSSANLNIDLTGATNPEFSFDLRQNNGSHVRVLANGQSLTETFVNSSKNEDFFRTVTVNLTDFIDQEIELTIEHIGRYQGLDLATAYLDNFRLVESTCTTAHPSTLTDETTIFNQGDEIVLCGMDSTTLEAGSGFDSYLWSNGATSEEITVYAEGYYYVTVTTDDDCTFSHQIYVKFPDIPEINEPDSQIGCNGTPLVLRSSSFSNLSSYFWNTGETTRNITVEESGTYIFTATSTDGCSNSDTVTVTFIDRPVVELGDDRTGCLGEKVTLDAGPGHASYLWSNGQTTQSIEVGLARNYIVTVANEGGCTMSDTVLVSFEEYPFINLGRDIRACQGDTVLLEAPDGDYNYLWSTGETTRTIKVTETKDYNVAVSTEAGCSSTDEILVTFYENPVADLSKDITICEDETARLDGGIRGFTFDSYLWNTGETTRFIEVSEPGTYTVTVGYFPGCTSSYDITVIGRNKPDLDLGPDITECREVVVQLDAGPGYASYEWDNVFSQNRYADVLTDGTYSVTVTDSLGCSATDEITVTYAPIVNYDLGSNQTICNDQSTTLDAGEGFTDYLWSTGDTTQTITVNEAGTYSVTVANEQGCTASDEIIVSVSTDLLADLPSEQAGCQGETLILNAGEEFNNYAWNTGETTQSISVQEAGTYTVTVTNSLGCTESKDISVTFENKPTSSTLQEEYLICEGASIELDAGPGFSSYEWSNGFREQRITISETGIYTITIGNAAGCTSSYEVNVLQADEPEIDLGRDITLCAGDSITLDAGEGHSSYLWNDFSPTQTLKVKESGTYYVTVTNEAGCQAIDEINVSFVEFPTLNLGESRSTCEESIELDAGPGFTSYLWNDGSTGQRLNATSSDIYSVTVTNETGCASTDEVTLTFLETGSLDLGDIQTICENETIELDAGDGFSSYVWSNGSASQKILIESAGTYSVTVVSPGGCTSTDEVIVDLVEKPVVNLGEDILNCQDEPITLNAGGGFESYLWNTGATGQTIEVIESGEYTVTVTNKAACTASDDVQVRFNEIVEVALGEDITLCGNESVWLDAGAEYENYLWNDGSSTQSILVESAGTYSVTVTNSVGCTTSDTISVSFADAPTISLGENLTGCEGDTFVLDAGDGFTTYRWSDGSLSQSITVSNGGTYSVTVTNEDGCTATDEITVTFNESIVLDLGENQSVCQGETVTLDVGEGFESYQWSTGETSRTIEINETGIYSLTVTNENGCTATGEIAISYEENPVVELGEDREIIDEEFTILDAGEGFASYLWNTEETTQSIRVETSGSYSVTVENETGCEGTDEINVQFGTPLSVRRVDKLFTYYPNPVKDFLTISQLSSSEVHDLHIYRLDGKVLYKKLKFQVTEDEITVDLSNLSIGMHLMIIDDQSPVKVYKR